jgi:glucokinase
MPYTRQFIALAQSEPPYYVGVDVGGTNIKVGVVDNQGRPMSWLSIHTEVERGPDDAVGRMREAVRRAVEQAGVPREAIARVGLGTPGTMDIAQGILLTPGNLPGWWHYPIRDRLAQACDLPVTFANDARSATYGEFWVGSGRVFHSMVLFTLGTGVGGGIIIGDLLVTGEHSAGSELGHIIIDYNDSARVCSCQQRGHLEAYASATSVVKRTQEALTAGRDSSLRARIDSGEELTALMIDQEAERDDELALEIVLETARFLGIGIVTAMHSVDPQGIVIGGAMTFGERETATGRRFLARIKEEVARRAFPELVKQTTIDFASLGGDAGFIGAAGLARREHMQSAMK